METGWSLSIKAIYFITMSSFSIGVRGAQNWDVNDVIRTIESIPSFIDGLKNYTNEQLTSIIEKSERCLTELNEGGLTYSKVKVVKGLIAHGAKFGATLTEIPDGDENPTDTQIVPYENPTEHDEYRSDLSLKAFGSVVAVATIFICICLQYYIEDDGVLLVSESTSVQIIEHEDSVAFKAAARNVIWILMSSIMGVIKHYWQVSARISYNVVDLVSPVDISPYQNFVTEQGVFVSAIIASSFAESYGRRKMSEIKEWLSRHCKNNPILTETVMGSMKTGLFFASLPIVVGKNACYRIVSILRSLYNMYTITDPDINDRLPFGTLLMICLTSEDFNKKAEQMEKIQQTAYRKYFESIVKPRQIPT